MQEGFARRYDSMGYDYDSGEFVLARRCSDQVRVQYRLQVAEVEKRDRPQSRNSLYMHEYKNASKYFEFTSDSAFPKYIQDYQKRMQMENLLDVNNPLGIPTWAQPLSLRVEMEAKDGVVGFVLRCTLGKVYLDECYGKKQAYQYKPQPYNINKTTQEVLFGMLADRAGVTEQELGEMSKLMFVGGAVQRLEFYLDLFEAVRPAALAAGVPA